MSRQEFEDYYRWATSGLPQLQFNSRVEKVDFDDRSQLFEITVDAQTFRAKNVVVGTGLTPCIPACCENIESPRIFHAGEFAYRTIAPAWKRIALVGGGQTAAELFLYLMQEYKSHDLALTWVTRRHNLLPMDDSPFINEFFYPEYSEYFFDLAPKIKDQLLNKQRLASDGISLALLQSIHQRLYEQRIITPKSTMPIIMSSTELLDLHLSDKGVSLQIGHEDSNRVHNVEVDAVILCTGYEYRVPEFLALLINRFDFHDSKPRLQRDFSVHLKSGDSDRKLYLQNAGRHTRGVADPNLSLTSWRSATILNSIFGREIFDLHDKSAMMSWQYPIEDETATLEKTRKVLANV